MVTITGPDIVHDWLTGADDESPVRLYRYTHRTTGQQLYAAFWSTPHDDMQWAPDVTEAECLLHERGVTPVGEEWLEDCKWLQESKEVSPWPPS